MNETVVITQDNLKPLQDFIWGLSSQIQQAVVELKLEVDTLLSDTEKEIDFDDIQRKIQAIFNTVPTRFVNTWEDNVEWSNEWSLRILAIALLFKLTDSNTLRLFGKHWTEVQATPHGEKHQNIRQLDGFWLSGVKIYGVPFSEKQ